MIGMVTVHGYGCLEMRACLWANVVHP